MTGQVQSSVLKEACKTGDFAQLQNLVADANGYDEKGGFLLVRFVETEPFTNKHVETLPRLMTELNANVNLAHRVTKKTALHCAASFGNIVAVRTLLDNGAAVNSRDKSQSTPLTYCASFAGNSRVIEYLLSRGALINAVARLGQTALHFAVDQDQIENARVLLMHGADRNICDINGKTPLQRAKNNAMRDLFSRTIEQLKLEVEQQQTERVAILLNKANPLQEAIESSDPIEARLIMEHSQFTTNHLEEGFKFAFKDELLKNYDFIFKLFKKKPSLSLLVERILNNKLIEIKNLQNKIKTALEEKNVLSQPDTRTGDDFNIGRGDAADQAIAIMEFRNYLQSKDYIEGLRVAKLEEQNIQIRFLSEDIAKIKNQIKFLKKFQKRFNPVTDLETGIQELAINKEVLLQK